MRKEKIKRFFLILLPVLAVGIACSPGSVILYEAETKQVSSCSYFALLPEGTFRISTVLAGILASLSGGLSFTYLVSKKAGLLKAIMYISFAAAVFAEVPILVGGSILVLPNVGVPILLIAHACVAYFTGGRKRNGENRRLKP